MVSCGYEVLLPQRSLMYFSKCRHSTIWLCHRLSILSRAFLRENLLVLFSVIPKSYSIIQSMVQPCGARGHVPAIPPREEPERAPVLGAGSRFLFLRVVLGRKRRKPGRKRRRQCLIYSVRWWGRGRFWNQTTASTSISTSPPRGNSLTATQERAGGFSANTLEYSALTNGKSAMLVMNTVVLTTFSMPAPAAARRPGCSSGSVPSGPRHLRGACPWRDRCRAVRSSTGPRRSGRLGSKGRWLRAHRRWRGWFS